MARGPGCAEAMEIRVSDVSRVYFHAAAVRHVYVQLVDEDKGPNDHDKRSRLNASMRGDAALNRHQHYRDHPVSNGFEQGAVSPRLFHHPDTHIRVLVHGDDSVPSARDSDLQWLASGIGKVLERNVQLNYLRYRSTSYAYWERCSGHQTGEPMWTLAVRLKTYVNQHANFQI